MNDQVWWYATRAAGLMTWSTAVASVIVGLLLSTRAIKSRTGPWMLDLHRFLGGISVLFLAVHLVTLYFDSFVDFGPREIFIPGESTWNSEAAAWGIIAMYALILVELTSLLRRYISQNVWRTFHMLSVVTAVAGTYHAILGGTDVDNPLTWVVAGAGSAIVIALVALRLKGSEGSRGPRGSRANDREALLQEMRDRLESLPIPADTPVPEFTSDGSTLPRRAPLGQTAEAPADDDSPADEPAETTIDEPVADAEASTSPFASGANPFATAAAQPATAPDQDAEVVPPADDDPFAAPAPSTDPADDNVAPATPAPDPFGLGLDAAPPAPVFDPFSAPAPEPNPFAVSAEPEPLPPTPEPFLGETAPDPAVAPPPEPAAPVAETPSAAPFLEPADLTDPDADDDPLAAAATELPPLEPSSPFGSELPPLPPLPALPPLEPLSPESTDPSPSLADDLFAAVTPAEEAAQAASAEPLPEFGRSTIEPFSVPVDPPAEPPTQPDAAPAPTPADDPFGAAGASDFEAQASPVVTATAPPPPPVPDAVDPVTGEPDEAAYSAWLVEWLAYAEKYGEETPEDPDRVG